MPDLKPDPSEAPASVLTRKQREYLLGHSDIEPASRDERSIRSRIRSRVAYSTFDLWTLLEHLQGRDRDKVAETLQGSENPETEKVANITNRCGYAIGFFVSLILGLREFASVRSIDRILEAVFRTAIREAFIRRGDSVERVEIDILIEQGPRFEELEKDDLTDLPRDTLGQMLNAKRITPEQYSRAILSKDSENPTGD